MDGNGEDCWLVAAHESGGGVVTIVDGEEFALGLGTVFYCIVEWVGLFCDRLDGVLYCRTRD
jgi:hypothetical protein